MKTQILTPKKAFNFEIYTENPETGETGWEIKFIDVFAFDIKEARMLLTKVPNYDCVILFNHCVNISDEQQQYIDATNSFYKFETV
jgi:hypothetical protein